MIKWRWAKNDFFVEMIPATQDHSHLMGPALKALGLKTIDRQKHYDHPVRRGIVRDMNPNSELDVKIGDVVVFGGAAGFTMDGDLLDEGLDNYGKGEGHRWLRDSEVMAVDEAATEAILAPVVRETANV